MLKQVSTKTTNFTEATKQRAWLDRILFPDSNGIKFAKFGRVDLKL